MVRSEPRIEPGVDRSEPGSECSTDPEEQIGGSSGLNLVPEGMTDSTFVCCIGHTDARRLAAGSSLRDTLLGGA